MRSLRWSGGKGTISIAFVRTSRRTARATSIGRLRRTQERCKRANFPASAIKWVTLYLDLDVPPEKSSWFETALECAAFLAFELAERRNQIRFMTQGFDVTIADDADIYTILRYLALVSPRRGKPEGVPR